MADRISVTITNGVADVRMVRTDKMNALDEAMMIALVETGERLKTETGLRAVVLSGEGRAFSAGLDMANFQRMESGERKGGSNGSSSGGDGSGIIGAGRTPNGANRAQQTAMVWREVPVPVIAAVHGVAFGGGFQVALGADVRFVAPDVRLSIMEIKWGLIPDMGGMELLRHFVRDDVLRDLTYTGRIFDGTEALNLGIATRVCADPRTEALAYAAEIAGKNPDAIRAGKRLLNLSWTASCAEILKAETDEQLALIGTPNQVEAIRANMQKRAPNFTD